MKACSRRKFWIGTIKPIFIPLSDAGNIVIYFGVNVLFTFYLFSLQHVFRELFDDQLPSVVGYRLEVNVVGAKEVVTQLITRYELQLFRQTNLRKKAASQSVA